MSLPSAKQLQSQLHDFEKTKPLIPLKFIEEAVPRIIGRYSSGLSVPVVLDEVRNAWVARASGEKNTDIIKKVGRHEVPLVSGVIEAVFQARNGETSQAVIRDLRGGKFQWFVPSSLEKVLKAGIGVKMLTKVVQGIPRSDRGLDVALPTQMVILQIHEKSLLSGEPSLQLAYRMTLQRVWNERDLTPKFVSGKVTAVNDTKPAICAKGDYPSITIQDIDGDESGPQVNWIVLPELRGFCTLIEVEDRVLLKNAHVIPNGNSFILKLAPHSMVYAILGDTSSKPKSPSNIAKARFSSRPPGNDAKRRRLE